MKNLTKFAAIALTAMVLSLLGCQKEPTPSPAPKPSAVPAAVKVDAEVLTVLATSDLRDVLPLEQMVEKATGVKLKFSFGGTMESTEAVQNGKANADAAWFANAKYLLSDPAGQARV